MTSEYVDREARDTMIDLILELTRGEISNDEFEACLPATRDPAIQEIYTHGVWYLYDDALGQRIDADNLATEVKLDVDRWLMFLRSDTPYRWPRRQWLWPLLTVLGILTFGLSGRLVRRWWRRQGDQALWPFRNREELLAVRPEDIGNNL